MAHPTLTDEEIFALEQPSQKLFTYFFLFSLMFGPGFPVALTVLYFRYRTLSYKFDDEGVSMSWGILFRREIHLTYSRIQDIHLVSNIAERWLGLARIKIQTASGSSKAEMTIEGIEAFEALRDFLYTRMRGAQTEAKGDTRTASSAARVAVTNTDAAELTATLRDVATELRALRQEMAATRNAGAPPVEESPVPATVEARDV